MGTTTKRGFLLAKGWIQAVIQPHGDLALRGIERLRNMDSHHDKALNRRPCYFDTTPE
jgi:hypothetical protein